MPARQKAGELSEQLKVLRVQGIGVKVHDIVPNLAHFVEPMRKYLPVNLDFEFGPILRILQKPNVFTKRQSGYTLNISTWVLWVLNLLKICQCESLVNQVADVILYVTEKEEWFSKLLELVADVECCDDARNSLVAGLYKNTVMFSNDLDGIEE